MSETTGGGLPVFGIVDYAIFILMLLVSMSFGIYFGFISKAKETTEEYLLGGRKLKVIPVAISMVAGIFTTGTIVAFPAEMYAFGFNFFIGHISLIAIGLFICYCMVPIYYDNNISTCYEYLELRFDSATRKLGTFIFIGTYIIFLPMYLYLPSYAFSQISNSNAHLINAIVSSICVFYTMLGGIKAVIWTDVVQGVMMFLTVLLISTLGFVKVGFFETFRVANEGHRLDIDFTLDLQTRATFWNSISNCFLFWLTDIAFDQPFVQRLISLPSKKHAQKSVLYFTVITLIYLSISSSTGIIMYAYYRNCDPMLTGQVRELDKMVPHFVQDIAGHLTGVTGLFLSGIFSAGLSTTSSAMNALSGVIYFDYIKPFVVHTERKANFIMKLIILVFGVNNVLGGFVVDRIPSYIELMVSFDGVTYGAIFGLFIVGMLVPRVHGKAIFWAAMTSLVTMATYIIYTHGKTNYPSLPHTSTESCAANNSFVNDTISFMNQVKLTEELQEFDIFKISFNWYIAIGATIVFAISIILSYILPKPSNWNCNRKLLLPMVHRFTEYQLPEENFFSSMVFLDFGMHYFPFSFTFLMKGRLVTKFSLTLLVFRKLLLKTVTSALFLK